MKLSQLRHLIAIAEHGSLRAAARAQGVSAPALVKSINWLESELHVPLLVRSSRGVALSEYGKRFLHRARLIDAETRKAADEIAELRGQFEGAITVGASPTPSITLLPEVLLQFRRKFPSVRVNIVGGLYHTHLSSIRAGAMDLALGPIPDAGLDAAFRTEGMFLNEIIIVARKGHPLAGARSLRELSACEWVLTGPDTQGPGAAIFDAFRRHGLEPPRRVIQCDITWTLHTLLLEERPPVRAAAPSARAGAFEYAAACSRGARGTSALHGQPDLSQRRAASAHRRSLRDPAATPGASCGAAAPRLEGTSREPAVSSTIKLSATRAAGRGGTKSSKFVYSSADGSRAMSSAARVTETSPAAVRRTTLTVPAYSGEPE